MSNDNPVYWPTCRVGRGPSGGDIMVNDFRILDKHPGGWTLIVLLIVVAIIVLLMALYLPSVLQMYAPPTTTDEEGNKEPVLEHVKEQLAPIETRNKQLEKYLPGQGEPEHRRAEQNPDEGFPGE